MTSCDRLGSIAKIHKCLTKKLFLLLYTSLVLPYINHGDTINNYTTGNHNKLQLVQNKPYKLFLMANSRTHISDMHRELNLPMLDKRCEFYLCCLCHKTYIIMRMLTCQNTLKSLGQIGEQVGHVITRI